MTRKCPEFESLSLRHISVQHKVVPIIFIRRSTQVGRRGRFAKPLGRELPAQGFESLLLRQNRKDAYRHLFCFVENIFKRTLATGRQKGTEPDCRRWRIKGGRRVVQRSKSEMRMHRVFGHRKRVESLLLRQKSYSLFVSSFFILVGFEPRVGKKR